MFRFRLLKVLKHRRHVVENEALRLQALATELNRLVAGRLAYEADIETASEAAHGARRVSVSIAVEQATAAFGQGRRRQIEHLAGRLGAQQAVVETQRLVLIKAQQAVSALERLESRQRAEWEHEERRREQKHLDEVAGRRRAYQSVEATHPGGTS